LPVIENLDHREAGKACKSESAQNRLSAAAGDGVSTVGCETTHRGVPASGLSKTLRRAFRPAWVRPMKTRRLAFWWFRFVISGRFLGKFLKRPRA
jgi:hypothetical protein